MSNKNVAQYVMLAEVSYADLTDRNGTPLTNNETYSSTLIKSGFADAKDDGQITLLKNNWDVVANWKDHTDESSFSATLFKGKSDDNQGYVLAFKGSKEIKDFLVADAGDIVLDGFALKQSIDLINFRQYLTTKDDNYKVIVLETLEKDKELESLNLKIKTIEYHGYKSPTGLSIEQKKELAELQAQYK